MSAAGAQRVAVVTGGTRGIGRTIALTLARGGTLPVCVYRDDAQAAPLVDRIRVLVAARDTRLRDIAVLATTNGMLDAVAFALAQADIPYVVSGRSFFRAREVRDLHALLTLVLKKVIEARHAHAHVPGDA